MYGVPEVEHWMCQCLSYYYSNVLIIYFYSVHIIMCYGTNVVSLGYGVGSRAIVLVSQVIITVFIFLYCYV